MTHGDVGDAEMSLVWIDPANGEHHQVAGSLPSGTFTLHGAELYLAAYTGEIGTVDLASGAYAKLTTVDGTARAVAVTRAGLIVGTTGHLELYARDGTPHAVAGSQLGVPGDFDSIVDTPSGVFAASQVAGTVLRVDGDRATVIAKHQTAPGALAATKTHLVWTIGEGTDVGEHLVGMPLAGGRIAHLADAVPPALIQAVATRDALIAYATGSGQAGEILTVTPGTAPHPLASAPARLIAISSSSVCWVQETATGWAIRAAARP
jgi:hypothetical protein